MAGKAWRNEEKCQKLLCNGNIFYCATAGNPSLSWKIRWYENQESWICSSTTHQKATAHSSFQKSREIVIEANQTKSCLSTENLKEDFAAKSRWILDFYCLKVEYISFTISKIDFPVKMPWEKEVLWIYSFGYVWKIFILPFLNTPGYTLSNA